jgi:amicoumacin kinase
VQVSTAVLEKGASLFDADAAALHSLGGMDGAVYAYEEGGEGFILKFVPVPLNRIDEVREKWDFARHLSTQGVRGPEPIFSRNGHLIETVQDGDTMFAVSRPRKAPGKHIDRHGLTDRADLLFGAWGRVMGRMHALTKQYAGGHHIVDWQQELQFMANWCEDGDVRVRWGELEGQLQVLPQTADCYGLIHNDLHPENFLVHYVDGKPQITVIDFDVCAYHWFATDIAIAMFPLFVGWMSPPDKGMDREAFGAYFFEHFMRGYIQENQLDSFWLKQLPMFLKYRQMLLFSAFSNEWQERDKYQERLLEDWRCAIVNQEPVTELSFELL